MTLPLATLDRDVTHLLVKVGAGGNKLTASHRVDNFPEWKLILNQAGLPGVTNEELKTIVTRPRHRRKFTRIRDQSGPCQHPFHQGEKTKFEETEEGYHWRCRYIISGVRHIRSSPIPSRKYPMGEWLHACSSNINLFFAFKDVLYTLWYSNLFIFIFISFFSKPYAKPASTKTNLKWPKR